MKRGEHQMPAGAKAYPAIRSFQAVWDSGKTPSYQQTQYAAKELLEVILKLHSVGSRWFLLRGTTSKYRFLSHAKEALANHIRCGKVITVAWLAQAVIAICLESWLAVEATAHSCGSEEESRHRETRALWEEIRPGPEDGKIRLL